MGKEDDKNGKKRPLSWSEKFRNYCIGIAALTGLILGAWANLKGEPKADKAWDTSQEAINKNRGTINKLGDGMRKLHLMFVHMQGQQEGYNNAKLMAKIDKLEDERLKTKPVRHKPVVREPKVGVGKLKPCPPGWVRIKGKCSKNRVAIAKATHEARKDAEAVKRKLEEERKRRKEAERAKMKAQQLPKPQPPAKLLPLPKKLDDAAK